MSQKVFSVMGSWNDLDEKVIEWLLNNPLPEHVADLAEGAKVLEENFGEVSMWYWIFKYPEQVLRQIEKDALVNAKIATIARRILDAGS